MVTGIFLMAFNVEKLSFLRLILSNSKNIQDDQSLLDLCFHEAIIVVFLEKFSL